MSNDKSIYHILEDAQKRVDPEDFVSDVEDAANKICNLDDDIREIQNFADDFNENFNYKSIKELREYCEKMAESFEEIQGKLYGEIRN